MVSLSAVSYVLDQAFIYRTSTQYNKARLCVWYTGPFGIWSLFNHLNTFLVRSSDPHCICFHQRVADNKSLGGFFENMTNHFTFVYISGRQNHERAFVVPWQDNFGCRAVHHREHDRVWGRQIAAATSFLAKLRIRRSLEICRTIYQVRLTWLRFTKALLSRQSFSLDKYQSNYKI